MTPPKPVALVVRLPARLHARARRRAFQRRTSLNKLLVAALAAYLKAGD